MLLLGGEGAEMGRSVARRDNVSSDSRRDARRVASLISAAEDGWSGKRVVCVNVAGYHNERDG